MATRMVGRCRRLYAVMAALAALCGCKSDSPDDAYRRVWSLYASGSRAQAGEAAAKGSHRFKERSDAAWFWKFRLLEAEALLAQGKIPQASAAIKSPVPLASSRLELRRLIDQADAYSKSGHPDAAVQLLD